MKRYDSKPTNLPSYEEGLKRLTPREIEVLDLIEHELVTMCCVEQRTGVKPRVRRFKKVNMRFGIALPTGKCDRSLVFHTKRRRR